MTNTTYIIIDTHTGEQVGGVYAYTQRNRARSRADKLDLAYGAYRYQVKPVFSKE